MKNFFIRHTTYDIRYTKSGFGLVEILIASAIIAVAFSSLGAVIVSSFRVTDEDIEKIQAGFLAEEGIEVLRLLRGMGWQENIASVTKGAVRYMVFNPVSSSWSLQENDPGLMDGKWRRTIILEDVYRRISDDDIVQTSSPDAKVLDIGTVKAISIVSWQGRHGENEITVETYLADLWGN